ncbi:MAG: hypothetical protein ACREEW_19420 [Caulobacteraceae bacterium]
MHRWNRVLIVGVAAAALACLAAPANAKPAAPDPALVQGLETQLQSALDAVGCSASTAEDIATVESAIAASGAQPETAQEALRILLAWPKLCSAARPAVASVNQTIILALANTETPTAGFTGAGIPIGGPPTFIGRDGADYNHP